MSNSTSEFPKPFQATVSYSKLGLNIISHGYIALPAEISNELEQLFPFAESFPACFGFDFESFRAMCQALAKFVYDETAFSELRLKATATDSMIFISTLSKYSLKVRTAPRRLFDLFARGIFKASRKDFIAALSARLSRDNQNASELAERFLSTFTYRPTDLLWHDVAPWLFFPLDDEVFALDVLAMNGFWNLCLRAVTSIEGEISNLRGDIFANQARDFLIKSIDLNSTDMPTEPDQGLKIGNLNYGDVDFAFLWKGMLINLDMKSRQKSFEYLRGDFHTINTRQKELQFQICGKPSNLEKRGRKLLEILRRSNKTISGVLSFLCVPHVEFISKKYEDLWYGNIPRVLTPNELATILKDDEKLRSLKEFLTQ